jgi:2,3-bisphosphoglycerate-dependent phosphoglycerate mutase
MGELQGKPKPKHWDPPPAVETKADLANRAMRWWNVSILQYISSLSRSKTPHYILVTSHGGLMRMLIHTLMESRKLIRGEGVEICILKNCSVVEIEVGSNRKGVLVRYGDTSHFKIENGVQGNADEIDERTAKDCEDLAPSRCAA